MRGQHKHFQASETIIQDSSSIQHNLFYSATFIIAPFLEEVGVSAYFWPSRWMGG